MEIPFVLDRIASAGAAGLALERSPELEQDIGLCRAWGYPVEVDGGRARIARNEDLLVPSWLESEGRSVAWKGLRVRGFLELGSTNDEALARVRDGAPEGTLIYALRQTAGKGRMGRKWESPAGAGLYFTLVLRPQQPLGAWPVLTHAASVALHRALHDLKAHRLVARDLAPELKWPNDVLLSGRKVAGILLETAVKGGIAEAAVLGIGLNVSPDSVPPGLSDLATAVECEARAGVPRRWLLNRILAHFHFGYRIFEAGRFGDVIEQWKACSTMWDGVDITVNDGERTVEAVTCGLTGLGALRIRNGSGGEATLLAGDVRIRRR